ncbi:hypothetical protein D6789_02035 [Candidatus Woesearchaeota archaeon]|nr:MAG: hypothetical protein D6789_02035 [Candidatus Woesearchaeota archaeon]
MAKKRVIVDTNALLLFAQGTDLFSAIAEYMQEPYSLIIIDSVEAELHRLAQGGGADARAAKLALVLVEQMRLAKTQPLKKIRGSGEYADDAIVAIAEDDKESLVVTLDKGLQRRLLAQGVRVLTIRQKRIQEV